MIHAEVISGYASSILQCYGLQMHLIDALLGRNIGRSVHCREGVHDMELWHACMST